MPRVVVRVMIVPPAESWYRVLSFALSLCLHCALVALLAALSSGRGQTYSAPDAASFSPKEKKYKIIWFLKGERLPVVDSGEPRAVRLPEAQAKAKQIIFTTPKSSLGRKQFIRTEPPKLAQQPEIPSPNLISLAAPPLRSVAAPARPEAKRFQPPEPKPYTSSLPAEMPFPELVKPAKPEIPLPPAIASIASPSLTRPPGRKFIPPSGGEVRVGSGPSMVIDVPPALLSPANVTGIGADAKTLAIISTTPTNPTSPPTITGDRADSIQIGGVPGGLANGGEGGSGGTVIPNLTVRGGDTKAGIASSPTASSLPPHTTPSSIPTRPPSSLPPLVNTPTVSVPQWPNARRVPPTVDSAFQDRPVYTTVLTPPNGLPDWVLWFSETTPVAPGVRVFMRPPVPRQMAWADALNAVTGGSEKTWVRARLTKEGMMVSINVNQQGRSQAAAAVISQILSRWLFSPALRNGQAIEADVLLEVVLWRSR